MSTATERPSTATHATGARRVVDTAQYGLAGFLLVVGLVVLADAMSLTRGFADQPVQPYAMPYAVGGVLVILAVLLGVATWRGDVPQEDGGEDVDLTERSDWATVAQLVAIFVVVIATIDTLGWAIVGAFLFAASARVLGSRTLPLDIAIGTALSLLTWYGFYSGLGIPIPAGVLDGVL